MAGKIHLNGSMINGFFRMGLYFEVAQERGQQMMLISAIVPILLPEDKSNIATSIRLTLCE
jgi:hypothetical protein